MSSLGREPQDEGWRNWEEAAERRQIYCLDTMLLLMAFGGAFQHAIRRLNRNFVLHLASFI